MSYIQNNSLECVPDVESVSLKCVLEVCSVLLSQVTGSQVF